MGSFGTAVAGLIVLLIGCIALFDGAMAPAMWQLLGIIWLVTWYKNWGMK